MMSWAVRTRATWSAVHVLVLVVVLAQPGCVPPPPAPVPSASGDAADALPELPELTADSVRRQVERATVRVRSIGCTELSLGSGVLLPGGVVLTNRHVVDDPREVSVTTWDGRRLATILAGVDPDGDLAVLQVVGAETLPALVARGTPVTVGEPVLVVGYPDGGPARSSRGEVVAMVDGAPLGEPADLIRISAEIRQGSSGGPVVDRTGQLVGLVVATERARGTGLAIPAVGLAARTAAVEPPPPPAC